MTAIKLFDDIHWVGTKDPELRLFDLYVTTSFGTTYNSYLVRGKRTALIDAVKDGFEDQLFARVREIVPLESIDFLVVNHNEPDHSGAISKLLAINPRMRLVCAKPAVPFLRNIINDDGRPIEGVKGGDKLDLGGLTLEFLSTPFMHWPDTMMAYNPEHRVLFSCDGYAAHYCPREDMYFPADDMTLMHEAWHYYDSIMRPFAPYSRKAAETALKMEIALVAPSHGPMQKAKPKAIIEKYLEWTQPKHRGDKKLVAILYASSYGNTKLMAESIAASLSENGLATRLLDVTESSIAEIRDWIESADGILVGSPTFAGDVVKPIWDAAHLLATVASTGKKAAAFGSYGWGGQAIEFLESYFEGLKLKVHKPGARARLVPSTSELEQCREFGAAFARFVCES